MYTSSHVSHNQTAQLFQFRKQFQIAALHFLLNKVLQALKETPDDCGNTFFNTTNFHRFGVHLFKFFSPPLKDQTDSDSLINTLLIHLLNQSHSFDTFLEHKTTDAELFKNELINVFN